MNKIVKIISNIIFGIIIVILATYLLLRLTNKIEIYNVMTGSMEEKIHAGDYVLILRKSDYKIGDVITYKQNNSYITHRIIEKDGNTFTTKGDANNTEDKKINKELIVGKAIFSGGILNFIINYKFILAGIFLSLYLLSCYLDSKKTKKKKEVPFYE